MNHEQEILLRLARIEDGIDRLLSGKTAPERYTVEQLAQRYRVTVWTVYGWCRAGKLRTWSQPGRKRFFSAAVVREMDETYERETGQRVAQWRGRRAAGGNEP